LIGLHAAPAQAHDRFDVEIEAAHPPLALHDFDQRLDRIDAKAEQGVVNAEPQGLEVGPPIGNTCGP
jgi:hypothetical protein